MRKDFDLVAFRDFCAGKPEGETYPLCSCHCALAQFGFPGVTDVNLEATGVPLAAFDAAVGNVFDDGLTFGALASRLSNLIGEGGNG